MDAREIIEVRPKDTIDEFQPGDSVTVNLHVREGDRTRVQAFQGNVIAGSYSKDKVPQPGATFTVRRVSYGIGVERVIPFYSPSIESVQVTRKGKVKQARLFYLRGLSGRKARIKEKR